MAAANLGHARSPLRTVGAPAQTASLLALVAIAGCDIDHYRGPQAPPSPGQESNAPPAAPSGPASLRAVSVVGDDAYAVGDHGLIVRITRETTAREEAGDVAPD